jgi:GDP-L-fucose synthase
MMIEETILKSFKNSNVLVTGGTGLIGRHVVKLLLDAQAHVLVASLDKINIDDRAKYAYGDLTEASFCREITKDIDFVFHVAGIKGSIEVTKSKPASFFVPLLLMNTNMLEASRVNGAKKLVYASSIGAYEAAEVLVEKEGIESGPPMDMYPGWAKRMAEFQIEAYKIQYGIDSFSVVRPCNVYGPGDNFDPKNAMVVPSLLARVRAGENPLRVWGDGSAIRDFAYSEDVAEGLILALYHGTKGRYVNLSSGAGISVRQLVETISEVVGCKYEFDATKPSGFPKRVMDISLAKKLIGYNPTTTLKEGIVKTWNWFLNNEHEYKNRKNYFAESEK